jgi:malate dehydrogenase (oxaloacetate-decarboxylating)
MLLAFGVRDLVVCDSEGILNVSRMREFGEDKLDLLELTNREGLAGGLEEAVSGRDLFVGVSKPGLLTEEMVKTMAKGPVILAMSNPEPEIMPDLAKAAGARIVCSGLSGFPNHTNNMLVFPGIFKGALDAGAKGVTDKMKIAAVFALAGLVSDDELSKGYVLPQAFSPDVVTAVADAVKEAWMEEGIDE